MTKLLKNNDVFVTYPQGQNQRKTKKYAGKYTRNKYTFTLGSATGVSTSGSTASGSYYLQQVLYC